MISTERRDWDSAFFGYPVASVRLDRVPPTSENVRTALEQAERAGIRLLYLFFSPLDDQFRGALHREGLQAVGGKADYALAIPTQDETAPDPEIVLCRASTPALDRLAFISGEFSRFRLDPGFRHSEFERLYHVWLTNSLAGANGKCVFVAGDPAQPKGLLTLEPGHPYRIGLFAIAPECRRQGLGRRLIAHARRLCAESGAAELRVATQTQNRAACRFYEICGFRTAHEEEIYHAWLPIPAPGPTSPG